MDYNEKELEQEIGISQPKYERFCALHAAIMEKRQKYVSSMNDDTRDCNWAIKELDTQLSQKGQDMLVAQVAGDTDTVQRISKEVEEINARISDMRQRIYGYSKVDINDLLLDDLDELRTAYLDCAPERKSVLDVIYAYRDDLERQKKEMENKIQYLWMLSDIKYRTPEKDMLSTLVHTMYPSKEDTRLHVGQCMKGYGDDNEKTILDIPVRARVEEIYQKYGKEVSHS